MTITKIESDTESMSLIFSVDVTDLTGTLDVILDRTFFDSIYDGVMIFSLFYLMVMNLSLKKLKQLLKVEL